MFPLSTERHDGVFTEVPGDGNAAALRAAAPRLPRFLGLEGDAGATLSNLRVAFVGAGAIGSYAAEQLVRAGIKELWVIDPGRFEPENLQTQAAFPEDLGHFKARRMAQRCKRIAPATRVSYISGRFQELEWLALANADVVFLATDNLRAEVEVGQSCLHLGRPLIQASVHGDTLTAQIRFFANDTGAGPCPACGFTAAEWSHLNRETTFACGGGNAPQIETPPTMSVASLCSLAASLGLMQILKHALGLGTVATDSLLEYCGYTHRTVETPLRRNPVCPAEHLRWRETQPPTAPGDCTLRQLALAAGADPDGSPPEDTSVLVDGFRFVERGLCAAHGRQEVGVFLPLDGSAPCRICSARLAIHPFDAHRPVPLEVLAPVLDRRLRELSAGTPRWVLFRNRDLAFLFRQAGAVPAGSSVSV